MDDRGHISPSRRRYAAGSIEEGAPCFYSGTEAHPIFVDHVRPPHGLPGKAPVVMVHGAAHTGTCYLATPDRRPGWAPRFADEGRHVFVPDWPGHGRSPQGEDFPTLGTEDIARSLLVLLEEIGPAVLLVHSASGPMAWWMTEHCPDLVSTIVGIAPGPPANLLRDLPDDPAAILALRDDARAGRPVYALEDRPVRLNAEFAAAYWANTQRFPSNAFNDYFASIVPESARLLNERFNIGGRGLKLFEPEKLRAHRILIITGECDPRHPREVDEATANYFGAEHVWLPDRGITGNGHMMMLEDNSDELATLILAWLDSIGC
ncbi:alpha/beta fold hydrolase [Bradyrhizobium sp. UFLA05-109]